MFAQYRTIPTALQHETKFKIYNVGTARPFLIFLYQTEKYKRNKNYNDLRVQCRKK